MIEASLIRTYLNPIAAEHGSVHKFLGKEIKVIATLEERKQVSYSIDGEYKAINTPKSAINSRAFDLIAESAKKIWAECIYLDNTHKLHIKHKGSKSGYVNVRCNDIYLAKTCRLSMVGSYIVITIYNVDVVVDKVKSDNNSFYIKQ